MSSIQELRVDCCLLGTRRNVLAESDGHKREIVWPNWNGHGVESFGRVGMAMDAKLSSQIGFILSERCFANCPTIKELGR